MTQSNHEHSYLHSHRLLMRVALSLALTFAWIFVFQYFFAFSFSLPKAFLGSLIVYSLSQLVMMLLTPIAAAHLRRGVKRSMMFGALLLALSFAILGATLAGYFSVPLGWGLVLFALFLGAYRALYWIPYRLQAAHDNHPTRIWFEFLVALMPLFAGTALELVALGSLRLLFGASALAVLSLIPIFFLEDTHERFSWGYLETFQQLFDDRRRSFASRSVLEGMQSAALFLIWPLTVFLIVGRSYSVLGLVLTASLFAVLLLRDVYRKIFSHLVKQPSMSFDVIFAVSGWIFRLAAGSPIAVVFADSYSYVSAPKGAPNALSCEHVADGGSYIDEHTALSDIGLGLGRVVMCAATALMILVAPLPVALAFALIAAACASGGSVFLGYRIHREAY